VDRYEARNPLLLLHSTVSGKAKQTTMKRTNIILIIISLLTITGCSTEINIEKYVDLDSTLTLTVNKTNDQTGLTESETRIIEPKSEQFKKLIEWGNNNLDNWKSTPASYIAKVAVTQKDFRLLYNQDFVVIGFIDNDGKAQQYSKKVKKGELDFLTEISWATFRDTVNVGFVMTFKYPDNFVAENIQNGKCIGDKIENPENDITNSMKWCIWMQDTSDYPIDHFISSEKSIFKGQVTELRDTISINNSKAIRVTLQSDNKNDPYRQMIYLKKYSTLFEIINNYGADKDFETFYNSLTIDETKKPSH
jgi:hypothetical protein